MGGTDTGTTVLDGLVRARELGEVVANHLRLDLNRVEDLQDPDRSTSTSSHSRHNPRAGREENGRTLPL